jgi:hypothetical protein
MQWRRTREEALNTWDRARVNKKSITQGTDCPPHIADVRRGSCPSNRIPVLRVSQARIRRDVVGSEGEAFWTGSIRSGPEYCSKGQPAHPDALFESIGL